MFFVKFVSRSIAGYIFRTNIRTLPSIRKYTDSVLPTSEPPPILEIPPAELEISKENLLHKFLIGYVHQTRSTTSTTVSFTTLLEQLNANTNLQLPYTLPYENMGRKNVTKTFDLTKGIVTIAHVLPLSNKVIFASGFAVLDGGLIVTCAHTFYQAARCLSSVKLDKTSQTLAITHEGELIRVATVESHLVSSDLVLLRLQEGRKITSLAVDPYPSPVSSLIVSYNFVAASVSPTALPKISYSWEPAEVLSYKGRCGQEAATGTYDELSFMMYSHPPSTGSSGAPIVNKETMSVVGIVRGSEINYTNRRRIGFATPSECLFEVFKLPGMPDGLD